MHFGMLKEYLSDLSDAVIDHSGEIYQYKDGETITSWKPYHGLKNNNSSEFFFAVKAQLDECKQIQQQIRSHPIF